MPSDPSSAAVQASPVTLVTGPALAGKSSRLLALYREALSSRTPGACLWLAPTHRRATEIRARLLGPGLSACFRPSVMTFDQFAESILAVSETPMRSLGASMKRQLIGHLLDKMLTGGRLNYFRPIADRPGLVDLCSQFISELKRLEVWPEDFRAACQRRGMQAKDQELLELYETYQQRLNQHHLYDKEGRFWSARALLKAGQTKPFEQLSLVVVDGFTDFTRTEHEILSILAQRVQHLHISLLLEADGPRPDLFAKSRKTRERLSELRGPVMEQRLPRPARSAWPALAHLERELFKNPREIVPASETAGIEIRAAARSLGEVEAIARRIKKLLIEGDESSGSRPVAPSDIAVVFRSLTEAAPLVREVFTEFGLPFVLEEDEPLGQSRALAALVAVLKLQRGDWPFRELLAVLGNTYFQPAWPEWTTAGAGVAAERTIRDLQIASGRERLLAQTARVAETDPAAELAAPDEDEAEQQWLKHRKRRQTDAKLALAVLRRLNETLQRLPQRATSSQWGQALRNLAEEIGLARLLEPKNDQTNAYLRDRQAWQRLLDLVDDGDQLWVNLDEPPPELDRAEFLDLLVDLLRQEKIGWRSDETGRVRVLAVPTARALSIPYLFFAGLSEKAFPPSEREDRMYSEAEYQRLAAQGLPFVLRAERSQEEMLLFYEVLTRATRRLYLSYPGLDEKAQPLLPSPYVAEVERVLGPTARTSADLLDLSPIPREERPLNPFDRRVLAVHRALDGDGHLLAGLVQERSPMAGNLLAALEVVQARGAETFGPMEGVFDGKAAQQLLGARFGASHCWSPSHLEQYAYCPHQFFLQRVLGLEPLADLELEIDFAARGQRLHATLAALHRQINELAGRGRSPSQLEESEYQRLAAEAMEKVFARQASSNPLQEAMDEIDRRLVAKWLDTYRQQQENYDKPWAEIGTEPQPAHFEVSFGLRPVARDPLSTQEPLELDVGDEKIRLAGRIDRIDVGQIDGQQLFTILDYKTGSAIGYTKAAVKSGDALQLTLYALAVQDLLLSDEHAVPWRVGYWFVSDRGYKDMLALYEPQAGRLRPTPDWDELRPLLVQKVASLVHGIQRGEFPMVSADATCTSRCAFNTVCRVNQVRALEKVWPNPTA